ncbi:hypothetical protein HDV06_006988 [Boothiomyces sp. JEL0866]|nr:hypothetical protein HDV06_006988 [Boothiomyces sp. JEL0866]
MEEHKFLVIAGTYERLLYGLNGSMTEKELVPSFIYPAHISCITALACTPRFLATGSTDEHVKLYDLKIRKEIGSLMHHSGTITGLSFVGKHHLITTSEDGCIGIVRTSDWEHLKSLQGHVGTVLGLDVHPSGKVLLSVGKDKTLKCWDLQRAICSFSMKLSGLPNKVKWSITGTHFAVFFDKMVQINDLDSGKVIGKVEQKTRINGGCFAHLLDGEERIDVFVIGGDDKLLRVYKLDGSFVGVWESGHNFRVKDLSLLHGTNILATCGSDGTIFIWDLQACYDQVKGNPDDIAKITPQIASYNAKCRLTCICIVDAKDVKQTKKIVEEKPDWPESDYDVAEKKPKISVTYEDDKPKTEIKKKVKKIKKKSNTLTMDKKGKPLKFAKVSKKSKN